MIIGNGLVANAFKAYASDDRVLIFASGVSNSKETDPAAFEKEAALLQQTLIEHPDKIFVYFSTTSLSDSSLQHMPYIKHKLHIEHIIATTAKAYYIFRVANIVGKTNNPHTVLNYFYNAIQNKQAFQLWQKATRNLIDMDDIVRIAANCIDKHIYSNEITNIAYPQNIAVPTIVQVIADYIQVPALFERVELGEDYKTDTAKIAGFFDEPLTEPADYLLQMLHKYYRTPH